MSFERDIKQLNCYIFGTDENGYTLRTVLTTRKLKRDIDDFEHYDDKLDSSVSRSRSRIWELAVCNNWDYFFTCTLNGAIRDRFNLSDFHKDLTKCLYEYKRRAYKVNFLIIPEKHKNGAWHFHGLIQGLPVNELVKFKLGDIMSSELVRLVCLGRELYHFPLFDKKFGYNTFEKINNSQAVCKYILKYINKDVARSVTDVGEHTYYCSRGLNGKVKVIEEPLQYFNDLTLIYERSDNITTVKEYSFSPADYEKLRCFIEFSRAGE